MTARLRGFWRIGVEHEAKACQPLGYLANPYRTCVSIVELRGPGTVEVLFDVCNPREPRVISHRRHR